MSFFLSIVFLMSIGNPSGVTTFPQSKKSTVSAKVITSIEGNKLTITGTATNNTTTNQNIVYALLVEKNKNRGGNRSNNTQRGSAMVQYNETKKLSTTAINRSAKDVIYISLRIYGKDNKLLSEDTVTINE